MVGSAVGHDGLVEDGQGHPQHERAQDHEETTVFGAGYLAGPLIDAGPSSRSVTGVAPGLSRGLPPHD